MAEEVKMYRVDWSSNVDGSEVYYYAYIPAYNELQATDRLQGSSFTVREAEMIEAEAYVQGYQDGGIYREEQFHFESRKPTEEELQDIFREEQ